MRRDRRRYRLTVEDERNGPGGGHAASRRKPEIAWAAREYFSLPRLRGRGGEGALRRPDRGGVGLEFPGSFFVSRSRREWRVPPPQPSPASGIAFTHLNR